MDAFFAPIVDFVDANRAWAPTIVFLLALGETVAFVSILIPSTAILVGIGALVATGSLEFAPLWLGASLGALVGSTFSWWLGVAYGGRMLKVWPLNKDPEAITRGRHAFARWGGAAIVVGHFFGPLRAVVFLIAGASAMRVAAFQLANVPGALAWAYLIPKSGEVGGDVIGHLWRSMFGA
jgi:membrane protein DedA with SNARE-associated domain